MLECIADSAMRASKDKSMALITRLIVLVALAVAPALLIVAYHELDLRRSRETEIREHAERNAQQAVAEMRRTVDDVRRLSAILAKLPEVRQATKAGGMSHDCSNLLASLRQDYPGQIEFGIANKDGLVVCTTRGTAGARAVEGSQFRRAMNSNGFVIGSYAVSRTTGARYLTFAHPVRNDDGTATGAVLAGLDLGWLSEEIRAKFRLTNAVLSIHDRDLNYLVRVPEEAGMIGKPPPPNVQLLSRDANKGAIEAKGADGVRRVGAIATLTLSQDGPGKPDLHIAFGLSRDAVFREINAATYRGVALLGLSAVLAGCAAWYGGRRFIRNPVERLLAAAKRWREGDYAARVDLADRWSELGHLANAYEEMADALTKREEERKQAEQDLRASEERLRRAQDAGGIGLWDWDIRSGVIVWPESFRRVWEIDPTVEPSFRAFLENVHPDDRSAAKEHMEGVLRGDHPFDLELRTPEHDGVFRWIAVKGELVLDPTTGKPVRMIGICQDVTDRKRAEEHQALLINELNHRVKNTLATVQSIVAQSFRNSRSAQEAHESFQARLMALSRTHDILTRENWRSASLHEIVSETIAPYSEGANRFSIHGPELRLKPGTVVPLSMALHELCTNAVKYGALSNEIGRIAIHWQVTDQAGAARLMLRWAESNGPIVSEPRNRGFGSRLIERGLAHQLSGRVQLTFDPAGVVCTIEFPLNSAAELRSMPVPEVA